MDWIVRLPSALYRLSVKKAGTDRELQAHIRQYLQRWTDAEFGCEYHVQHQKIGTPGTVYCLDCQQVHTPGPCPVSR